MTGVAALVWLGATLLVLARGGHGPVSLPEGLSGLGTWALVGVLGLGVVMNLASTSPWERFGWGPFTLVLFVLCLVLARGAQPGRPTAHVPSDRDTPAPLQL